MTKGTGGQEGKGTGGQKEGYSQSPEGMSGVGRNGGEVSGRGEGDVER